MLTYQLQPRVFRIVGSSPFAFPNDLILELKYGPGTSYGTNDNHSRALVKGRKSELLYNANHGRGRIRSAPPLGVLEVIIESPSTRFELKGDVLQYHTRCENPLELDGCINAFHYVFPTLLNLVTPDPPYVEYTKGWLGEIEFRWEHREANVPFTTVTAESMERAIAEAYEWLPLFHGISNRRLAAALHYSHKASRLIVSGVSDWEFMSEAILNYCKTLEMLFVTSENTREDTRKGLTALGYTGDEIEGDFIPLLILRGFVDVAHAKVAIHKQEQLFTLYKYLFASETRFRALLKKIISAVKLNQYQPPAVSDPALDANDRAGMDGLIDTIQKRMEGGAD